MSSSSPLDPASRDAPLRQTIDALERGRVRAEVRARMFGDEPVPVRVGRFELRRRLGQGAMGIVYAAFDPRLRREIALKLLFHGPAGASESFLREARALAEITHPNVLAVYDAGLHEGVPYLVSELVTGGTLRQWLGQPSAQHAPTVAALLAGLAQGIVAAHEKGLVHRDIKPENVLVGADRRPRLADFSLAKGRAVPQLSVRGGSPPSDGVVGTLRYMSPEQLRGEIADERSDQWSFCALAYEASFGSLPFGDREGAALLEAIDRGDFVPVPRRHPIASALPLLRRGLAARREDRFASMADLARAWGALEGERGRRRLGIGVAAVAVVVSTVVAATVVRLLAPRAVAAEPARTLASVSVVGAPPSIGGFRSEEEKQLYQEAASHSQNERFTECADLLRGKEGEHLVRLAVLCADRVRDPSVLQRACDDAARELPRAPLPSCQPGALLAKRLAFQRRYRECIEVLASSPPFPQSVVQMSDCATAWKHPEGYYQMCLYLRAARVAQSGDDSAPPCVRQDVRPTIPSAMPSGGPP